MKKLLNFFHSKLLTGKTEKSRNMHLICASISLCKNIFEIKKARNTKIVRAMKLCLRRFLPPVRYPNVLDDWHLGVNHLGVSGCNHILDIFIF